MIKLIKENAVRVYAKSKSDAFSILDDLVGIVQADKYLSDRAGYRVYTFDGGTVSDLNTRLEVNYDDGRTVNIWIDR